MDTVITPATARKIEKVWQILARIVIPLLVVIYASGALWYSWHKNKKEIVCLYKVPLTKERSIPIDQNLRGLWEPVAGTTLSKRMMIFELSDTEYFIRYGAAYRGSPIEIGGVLCVQIEELVVYEHIEIPFHIVTLQKTDGQLTLRTINTNLVTGDHEDTQGLVEAFLREKDNPNLFENPRVFRKVSEPQPDSAPE